MNMSVSLLTRVRCSACVPQLQLPGAASCYSCHSCTWPIYYRILIFDNQAFKFISTTACHDLTLFPQLLTYHHNVNISLKISENQWYLSLLALRLPQCEAVCTWAPPGTNWGHSSLIKQLCVWRPVCVPREVGHVPCRHHMCVSIYRYNTHTHTLENWDSGWWAAAVVAVVAVVSPQREYNMKSKFETGRYVILTDSLLLCACSGTV